MGHQGEHDFLSIDHIDADPRVHAESLDASEAWPPLLRPGILMGHDAYGRWETRILSESLASVERTVDENGTCLASLLAWTDRLRAWQPSEGSLFVRIGKPWVPRGRSWLAQWEVPPVEAERILLNDLIKRIPGQWRPHDWPAGLTDAAYGGLPCRRDVAEAALARYLGTRLIGSWVAYQGEGLRSVLASLVSAFALATSALARTGTGVVTTGRLASAIRAADWILLHLLDREQWAAWCSQWERDEDSRQLVGLVATATRMLDDATWA